jgi:hypothetical protein
MILRDAAQHTRAYTSMIKLPDGGRRYRAAGVPRPRCVHGAQFVWVPLLRMSCTMATAARWVSPEPAENA